MILERTEGKVQQATGTDEISLFSHLVRKSYELEAKEQEAQKSEPLTTYCG
jgi:hypothetical protein